MYIVKELTYSEWEIYQKDCHKINLLQFWQYGIAKLKSENLKVIRYLIINQGGQAVALAQCLIRIIPFFGGIVRINRGPLLIGEYQTEKNVIILSKSISALMREFKKRRWWLIQVAPEMLESEKSNQLLIKLGFKKLAITPAASGMISLWPSKKNLLMNLKSKWRNCLRKGLRFDIKINILNGKCFELDHLLKYYKKLQENKKFSGISNKLILSLVNQVGKKWKFTLFIAYEKNHNDINKSIGMLVTICHGDTATYLIGSTNDKGRNLQANYVLLWRAILHAKENGCAWFDIGGLNPSTPKGVSHFKKGLNSKLYTLVGEWRRYLFPWQSIKDNF